MKTMKKALACLLVVAMFLTAAPLSGFVGLQLPDLNLPEINFGNVFNENAEAATTLLSGSCGTNLTWTIDDEYTLTISGKGEMYDYDERRTAPWYASRNYFSKVFIADGVTSIGNYAFYGYTNLASITLQNSVSSIGDYSFYNCTSLASITVPDSVTSIGSYAFYNCNNLAIITISDSVTNIGMAAFLNTALYFDKNNWDNNVLYINNHLITYSSYADSYFDCSDYTIKDGTKTIADQAFFNCSKLVNVTIPDSVTSIGNLAFYKCISLKSVSFGKNSQLTSIGNSAFEDCNSLESIIIPDSVKSIDENAFDSCEKLASVSFGENSQLTNIGNYAFNYCTSLVSITIPSTVTSIDKSAFNGCIILASVSFGENSQLISIGDYAFQYCPIARITIPDTVTHIGFSAFENCNNLTNVHFGDNSQLQIIDNSAFKNCTSLVSITIPKTITYIAYGAFDACNNLTSITILNATCQIYYDMNTFYEGATIYGYNDSTAEEYATKYNRTFVSIGEAPHTHSYTGTATLPATCCTTGLMTYTCECEDSYTEVIDFDFNNHTGGTEVRDAKAPTSTEEGYTGDTYCLGCNTKIANGESIPYTPEIIASGTCGANLTWTLDDEGTLTISGTGDMKNYSSSSSVPWYSYLESIKKVIIEDGVTSIGNYGFYGCSGLTSVTIGNSAETIGQCAFMICKNLTDITIPDSVTNIGSNAFYNTAWFNNQPDELVYAGKVAYKYKGTIPSNTSISLKSDTKGIADQAFYGSSLISVTIPDSVEIIGEWAFRECLNLTTVIIGNSVETISRCAFYGCTALTSVVIGNSVKTIENQAFDNCTSLTSVTLGNSVETIGNYAFFSSIPDELYISDLAAWCNISHEDFSNLFLSEKLYLNGELITDLVIPEGVTTIKDYAFYQCPYITSLTIPNSVTTIGKSAFSNCTGLKSITIPGSVTSIGETAFAYCDRLASITILNPACNIYNSVYTIYSDTIIYGYTGSTAEAYATNYYRTFVALDAHEHSYTGTVTLPATCCTTGVMTYTCECEDSYTEVIPFDFTNHAGGTEIRDARVATCTAEGYTGDTYCLGCNTVIVPGMPIISPPHEPGAQGEEERKEPTCTEDGSYTMVTYCLLCGEVLQRETFILPAIGHNYIGTVTTEPTCTVPGVKTYVCQNDASHTYTEEIPVTDHTWADWTETIPATYTQEGEEIRTCEVCGAEEKRAIDKLPLPTKLIIYQPYTIAKESADGFAVVSVGTTVADILGASNGTHVLTATGEAAAAEAVLATGMVLAIIDGATVVDSMEIAVLGDADGDGELTAGDARIALRISVGLDKPEEVYLLAAKVNDMITVTAGDARLLLRASVGLDDPAAWFDKF